MSAWYRLRQSRPREWVDVKAGQQAYRDRLAEIEAAFDASAVVSSDVTTERLRHALELLGATATEAEQVTKAPVQFLPHMQGPGGMPDPIRCLAWLLGQIEYRRERGA